MAAKNKGRTHETAVFAVALPAAAPMLAQAHGPMRQKVTETVEIAAPPAQVWARIDQFHDMGGHPAVAATTGDGGNAIDPIRALSLGAPDGPTLTGRLHKRDDAKRTYSRRITEVHVAAAPVTDLSSHLTVKDGANGGAMVERRGALHRG